MICRKDLRVYLWGWSGRVVRFCMDCIAEWGAVVRAFSMVSLFVARAGGFWSVCCIGAREVLE